MKSHRPPLKGGPPETGFADDGVHGQVNTMSRRLRQGRYCRGRVPRLPDLDTSFGFEWRKICVGLSQSITKIDGKNCEKREARTMPLQALGYAGFGSSSLDDW